MELAFLERFVVDFRKIPSLSFGIFEENLVKREPAKNPL